MLPRTGQALVKNCQFGMLPYSESDSVEILYEKVILAFHLLVFLFHFFKGTFTPHLELDMMSLPVIP